MAKGRERAVVDVVINNEAARKKVAELSEELETLTRKKREALKGGDLGLASALDKEVRKVRSELNQYRKEVVDVDHVLRNLNRVPLSRLQAAQRQLQNQIKYLDRDTKEYQNTLQKLNRVSKEIGTGKTGGMRGFDLKKWLGFGAIVAGISTGLKKIFGDMINVRREFQKSEAVLTNTLGSDTLMRNSMTMLQEFAEKTPYSLSELVSSYVKLANQGFKPTREEMRKMGDLASSQGKTFDQLTEAIIDAQTGEFERLKEFGIRASKEGNKVSFTFKGVKQQVDFTSASIRDYVLSLGDAEGVAGGMATISGVLEGKISNIGDAWDRWMNTLGTSSGGILSWISDKIISLVESLDFASQSIDQIRKKVRDKTASDNLQNALTEIDQMTQAAIRQGDSQQNAAKRALQLYVTGMQQTINAYKKSLVGATDEAKRDLEGKIALMEDELTLVQDHFKQEEERKRKTQAEAPKNSTKQWSLSGDESFLTARAELRKKHLAGEIATEDEFNRQLLALEVETLEKRIASRQESGAALARLQSELEEKRYQQTKSEQARYEKLIAASLEGAGENEYRQRMAAEQAAYDKRLKELGLFGRQRQTLTQTEQAALENLERRHLMKLQSIYTDGVVRNIQTQQQGLERELSQIKIRHNEELKEADTFEKKIALLQGWYSADSLQKVKTDAQADRLLKEHYEREEQEVARKHLEGLIAQYQKYLAEAKNLSVDGVALGTLNPEEVARIQGIIDDLNERLAALRSTTPTDGKDTALEKVDILGFSQQQWEQFYANLKAGEDRLGSWRMALDAIGNAFGEISKLMSAAEQREFKEYEKTAKRKKDALDRQLKAGMISQERYNSAVQQIDEETDRRREEMERKQAVRERAMAVFETLINTAVAVTAALKLGPIIGPILAGVIAGLGAAQTAAILTAPLPGAEDGGWLDVVRAQDGKPFRAKNDPRRRGYVSDPRVIVAEDGTEYVVPNEGYRNPTVRPVLDIIEQARRAGTLRSINLPAVIEATIPGRASGGYVSPAVVPTSASGPAPSPSDETTDPRLLGRIMDLLEKLSRRLEKPIRSEVSLTGRGGIHEAQNKYDRIRKGL